MASPESLGGQTLPHERAVVHFYQVLDDLLFVLSESPQMSAHIHCFMKNLETPPSEPTVRLAILQNRNAVDVRDVQLSCPELGLSRSEFLGLNAWIFFRRVFKLLALNPQRPNYVMHASCATGGEGRTALIVGASNSGKTSALIGLLERGYHMVGDDYSLIGFEDGRVAALPVGVTVTNGTLNLFPQLGALSTTECMFFCDGQWQWTINPADLYPACPAYERYEPTHLYFLYPDFGGDSIIEECHRETALCYFFIGGLERPRKTPRFATGQMDYDQRCLELAKRTVERVRFFKVVNGDINKTIDLIAGSLES